MKVGDNLLKLLTALEVTSQTTECSKIAALFLFLSSFYQ